MDFRGSVRRTVLRRMGIWDEVHRRQTSMGRQLSGDADDRKRVELLAHMLSGDVEIFRGQLARIPYERTRDSVTYVLGDSIASLHQDADGMDVTFRHAAPRRFDLVVGADGLHSHTRSLVFGPEERYLRFLGHYVAGFELPNHLGLDRTSRRYCEPGRMVSLAHHGPAGHGVRLFRLRLAPAGARPARPRRAEADHRGALPGHGLARPARPQGRPGRGRAVLRRHRTDPRRPAVEGTGGAARGHGYGATMGGSGSGTALVSAGVPAGELATADGDHRTAFASYEAQISGYARKCQKISGNAGPFLAPPTERRIRSRDRTYRLLGSRMFGGVLRRLTEHAAHRVTLRDCPQDLSSQPAAAS